MNGGVAPGGEQQGPSSSSPGRAGHRSAREADRTRGLLAEVVLCRPDSGPYRPWRRVQSSLRSSHRHLLPPPATSHHTHLFSFPCPPWYPYSPSSLVSISPSASSGSHTGGIIRQNTRLKRMDAPVSSYRPLPYPWILSFAEVGGPEIFSGVGKP